MNSNPPTKAGATGASAFFFIPPLPTIVAEWTALIPLIVHLASLQDDHLMIGEMTLKGYLLTGLFPKLGQLNSISKLLRGGPDFLDRVSSTGAQSSTVWDVSWGSVFPCANGAARDFLMAHALRNGPAVINVEEWTAKKVAVSQQIPSAGSGWKTKAKSDRIRASENSTSAGGSASRHNQLHSCKSPPTPVPSVYYRPQILHVVEVSRGRSPSCTPEHLRSMLCSSLRGFLWCLVLLGLALLLCLFGAYGTASVVLSAAILRIMCRFLPIQRPHGYLKNNEMHDACMLTAIHENASIWTLYKGDRSVVDWLLNKTMIVVPQSSIILYHCFRWAHYHQLLAMTYVAAQKGWDGVCLLSLMIIVWLARPLLTLRSPAAEWLKREDIHFHTRSFEFNGRTPMIGAVQLLSDIRIPHGTSGNAHRNTVWMDSILAPCVRRNTWTQRLLCIATKQEGASDDVKTLDQRDQDWVMKTTKLSVEGMECIEAVMAESVKTTV